MINGLFMELSEEEMLSVNGACAGGANPYAAMQPCQECIDKGNNYLATIVNKTIDGAIDGGISGAAIGFIRAVTTTPVPEPHSEHAN